MQCPRLSELPPPPPGKTGWPWTEETPPVPDNLTESHARISIVTPSFNSIHFLEETLRSVLLQGYPDLEYIIIDGGSTDGAVDIIRKYEKWITYWVSEKDRGYADAVNKGFARATGDIRAWLPASDLYFPSALLTANRYLGKRQTDFIFGRPCRIDEDNQILRVSPLIAHSLRQISLYALSNPCQPATFWLTEIHKQAGQLNTNLRYAADSEWFLRISLFARSKGVPETLCYIRQHDGQLSANLEIMRNEWLNAWNEIIRKYRISRLHIFFGALFYVPMVRYRSGGLTNLIRVPSLRTLRSAIFKRRSR